MTRSELQRLADVVDRRCDGSLVSYHGAFTAIASGPSLIMPDEWLDYMGLLRVEYESDSQRQVILSTFLTLYDTVARQLRQQKLRPLLSTDKRPLLIDAECDAAGDWARGYLQGMRLDSSSWREKHDALNRLLSPIVALTLSDSQLAQAMKSMGSPSNCKDYRLNSLGLLATAVNDIYQFWWAVGNNSATH